MLKCHAKNCLEINHSDLVSLSKGNEYVNSQNFKRLSKSPFIIYGDFECFLIFSNDNN